MVMERRGLPLLGLLAALFLLSGCGGQTPWLWAQATGAGTIHRAVRWDMGISADEALSQPELQQLQAALRSIRRQDCRRDIRTGGSPAAAGLDLYTDSGYYILAWQDQETVVLYLDEVQWRLHSPDLAGLIRSDDP